MPMSFRMSDLLFFFFCNEFTEEGKLKPIHVHFGRERHRNAPKVWIGQNGRIQECEGNDYTGLTEADVAKAMTIIADNTDRIYEMWSDHFQDCEISYNERYFG